jgi:ATP-dependent Clp protease ATP-binding subunit ClpA
MKPRLGFSGVAESRNTTDNREVLNNEMERGGLEAARQKFTPEFINRIDKMVVFKPLGADDLDRILEIELNTVRRRVLNLNESSQFVFAVSASGKQFLLDEGTNVEYGARHLKRTIDRLVVQPLSRLIASRQILPGDFIQIDYCSRSSKLTFSRQDEGLALREMKGLVASTPVVATLAAAY